MSKKIPYRTYLSEEQLPKYWYNLRADMKDGVPPLLNPATNKPVSVSDLEHVFTTEGSKQEIDDKTRY
ncbi:MAG: TrpB-like pyridoxal-phosphate dependent enzyme, partial [Clostridia bacterium]